MLERVDTNLIPQSAKEIRLFSVIRDERNRLEYFLRYYSELGVARFFFIDNGSTDGTREFLAQFPNVHLFIAKGSFAESRCGSIWLQSLAADYGLGGWIVVADADELLIVPSSNGKTLPQFCEALSMEGAEAFRSILVDMYSDKPIAETAYLSGTDPLETCPYYESDTIYCVQSLKDEGKRRWRHVGGVRLRLFNLPVWLDKVALIKYRPGMQFELGQHDLKGARFSSMRGATLHFKLFNSFYERSKVEAARGEHWQQAQEYRRYAGVLADSSLTALADVSRRLRQNSDLLECGIMRSARYN